MVKSLLFNVFLCAAAAASSMMAVEVDYRTVDRPLLDGVEVLYVATDYMVVAGDGSLAEGNPRITVLEPEMGPLEEYVIVHLQGPEHAARAGELGTVLFGEDHVAIVRLSGEVPAGYTSSPGVHFVQPMRIVRPQVRSVPIMERGEYDDYVADMVAEINEDTIQAHIQLLEDFDTRYSSTDNYDTAAMWVRDKFTSYGIDAELQYFDMGSYDCENVVAEKPGVEDSTLIYIICGHLDSTSPYPQTDAPGADDNASGSVGVVEAARVMSPYNFRYTVRYLCFGGEEQGLYGSAYYASEAASAGDSILGVVNLDMVLYAPEGDDVFWVVYDGQSTNLALALDAVSDTYVPVLQKNIDYNPGMTSSDHSSFWNHGYPAVLGIEQEVYSNPYYHSTSDLLANYMEYFPFGTNCIKGSIATVAYLAEPISVGVEESGSLPVEPGLSELSIAPNPVSSVARVDFGAGEFVVSLFDLSGRKRQSWMASQGTVDVDLSDYTTGIYLIRAVSGGRSASRMLVVAR